MDKSVPLFTLGAKPQKNTLFKNLLSSFLWLSTRPGPQVEESDDVPSAEGAVWANQV